MILLWLKGLLGHSRVRPLGAVLGIGLTVALLACIGAFVASASSSMTAHAVDAVPVDWQIQLLPGTTPEAAIAALRKAAPSQAVETVGYADTQGFVASTGGTVQTTGPGKALGLGPDYRKTFPRQMRLLLGGWDGALLAQQTAANLHVTVGDKVAVERIGQPATEIKVAGIVALPNADSMFQATGLPSGAAPQAPPDNVAILPLTLWHQLFDPQAGSRPDTVHLQLHARLAHQSLPHDPQAAYRQVQGAARNLEARLAGQALVADNLGARLDAVRGDALYVRLLFLFLGLPGAILALLFTLGITTTGADRRRREQALLRLRGASVRQLTLLAGAEAACLGLGGILLGLLLTALGSRLVPGLTLAGGGAPFWMAGAAVTGLVVALLAILAPAWRDARETTVAASRAAIGRPGPALWRRSWLDLLLLAIAGLVFWQTWRSGYQVVLAPEGVAAVSVHYEAFIAPAFLWAGASLLALRLSRLSLERGQSMLAWMLRPLAAGLSPLVAASLGRQRGRLARGVALTALAFAFATSTAIFDTTYNAQSRVDAALTNGADVTVTGTAAAPASPLLDRLRAIPGVAAAAPLMHRYAYVGADLQDLFGIDPSSIGQATRLAGAYFANGSVKATLAALRRHEDGILVSEETVRDFQLHRGDRLNLRLQLAADHQYHVVPFRFVGVAREFPTAPKDSFLVANAAYLARQTGDPASRVVLMRTAADPAAVAGHARQVVAGLRGATVSEIGQTEQLIGSSLTAVDLRGLTRIELAFALLLIGGVAGLVLGLGLLEQRRSFVVLWAIGAKPRHLAGFLWSEGILMVVGGAILGSLTGWGVAAVMVRVLSGVFDPPPEALSIPWAYLALLLAGALGAGALAILVTGRGLRQPSAGLLRDL